MLDDCDLSLAAFGPGSYRGCDLRGNDLSSVLGAHHLKRVVLDRAQVLPFASALAVELDVSFGELSGFEMIGGQAMTRLAVVSGGGTGMGKAITARLVVCAARAGAW